MASGAQLSEAAGGFGGEFEASSSKKVTGEVEEVVAGGEIGVASANQVVDGTEGAGGLFGVFPTNQATVGEIGAGHDDLVIQEAEGLGGAIGVVSAVQVTKTGGFDGENGVVSANQLTREPEGVVDEIGMPSADQIIREPEGISGEIIAVSANHVKGETEASESVIRETAVNHETNEAGASSGDNKEVSLEAGISSDEIREVPVNNVTGEAEATRNEIDFFSASQASGEPAGMGGEIGVASADIMNETGGGSGKTEIASAHKGNPEPGGGDDEVGVASLIKLNMKPEGQISAIGIASVNQVIGELGDAAGESGVASANQMNGEPGAIGDDNGVASTNQENVEPGSGGGESCVASANQLIQQSGGDCNSFEMGSANQMIGQSEGEGNSFEVAPANHLNGQPEGMGSKFGVASANQVNGKPGGRGGEVWLASANQLNEESADEIGPASAYQVNEEPIGEIRMASSNPVNGVSEEVVGEHKVEEKHRWVVTKVYRRRPKSEKKKGVLSHITVAPAQKTAICNGNGSQNNKTIEVSTSQSNHNHSDDRVDGSMVVETEKLLSVPAFGDNANLKQIQPETVGEVISNKGLSSDRMNAATPSLVDPPVTNGALRPPDFATDRRVKIKLASTAKPELQELKRKFESELYSVRKAVKRMDGGREEVVREFFHPVVNSSMLPNGPRSNGFATQVYSGTRSLGHVPYKPNIRPFNQLRVSVVENGLGMVDSIEREKRTPKANQFYRNSEFLLANDKFPPTESNKKSKSNGKKSSGGEFGFGVGSKVYKSCTALLEKLMKHKHGWVFNAPVDVKGLGLVDYFLIIKNPMDLGTVKAKLIKYWYKSPMEFAEDVRLTFHNAMLYNPKGHDVHIMAETLLKIFEGKWPDIEVKYLRELRLAVEPDMGYPTPTSRITNPFQSTAFPPLETRVFNRSESMPHPVNPKPRTLTPAPSFRTPALKKPKANDVNKRDMTYGEKQKLSTNLQSLPPEKLDGVIQIIKKRSTALSQNDDEIEVDIDSVDTETLWELDRFVTNYKKSLSKNRRKAELANQMRAEARQAAEKFTTLQPLPPKESAVGYGNATLSLPPHQNDPAANASRSSSSSSSSSSGSSSSDSDSDSSSEESDGGRSPGT